MRGISKKMFISILTSVIVMVTMVATTFAWVGIFTYANTEKFSLNLKVQELDANYFLTISSTGKSGTFSSEVPAIDIKRQIVNERYNNRYSSLENEKIEKIFDDIRLVPATTHINNDNSLDTFYAMNYDSTPLTLYETNGYYKFDLYLSVDTKEGITSETTGINANVFLSDIENTLTGSISNGLLYNDNPFQDLPSVVGKEYYDILKQIPVKYTVDSKNAVRFAITAYNPIRIDEEYTGNELPELTKIYQGGKEIPNYNEKDDIYDLGGVLPLEENLAIQELLVIRDYIYKGDKQLFNDKLNTAIKRNDYELIEENKCVWNKFEHSNYLGCMNGIQTKMKFTIYLWFEGWDSDCLKLIEEKPISLRLSFTAGKEE